MRNRILSYDSTFGLAPTAALALHLTGSTLRASTSRP